jgi:hypothetical protein
VADCDRGDAPRSDLSGQWNGRIACHQRRLAFDDVEDAEPQFTIDDDDEHMATSRVDRPVDYQLIAGVDAGGCE